MNQGNTVTVSKWIEKWLQTYVKSNLAYKTYDSYNAVANILNTYFPELNETSVNGFDAFQAQKIINSLADKFARSTVCSAGMLSV